MSLLSRFRNVSEVFQLLRNSLLEHGDLGAAFHYGTDGLVSQACHLFDLFSIPECKKATSSDEKGGKLLML